MATINPIVWNHIVSHDSIVKFHPSHAHVDRVNGVHVTRVLANGKVHNIVSEALLDPGCGDHPAVIEVHGLREELSMSRVGLVKQSG